MYDVLHGYKLKTENDAFGHFLITVSFQDVYFVEMCRLANWEFLKVFFVFFFIIVFFLNVFFFLWCSICFNATFTGSGWKPEGGR